MARVCLAFANGLRQCHRCPASLVTRPLPARQHVGLEEPGRSEAVRLSLGPSRILSQTVGVVREAKRSALRAVVGAGGTHSESRRSTPATGALPRSRGFSARVLVWKTLPCAGSFRRTGLAYARCFHFLAGR